MSKHEAEQNKSIIRKYLRKFLKTISTMDVSKEWIYYTEKGKLCCNNLLYAGLASFNLKQNVIIFGSQSSVSFAEQSKRRRNNKQSLLMGGILSRFNRLGTDYRMLPTVLIPIEIDRHWGMVYCISEYKDDDMALGNEYWGDSLGGRGSEPLKKTVSQFLEFACNTNVNFRTSCLWNVSKKNYITEIRSYKEQDDGFSCGFYLVSTLSEFSHVQRDKLEIGKINKLPARTHSEPVRQRCTNNYVKAVIASQNQKAKQEPMSEFDVLRFIMESLKNGENIGLRYNQRNVDTDQSRIELRNMND